MEYRYILKLLTEDPNIKELSMNIFLHLTMLDRDIFIT